MRCERCGRENPPENWDCDYCGAPLDEMEPWDSRPLAPRPRRRASSPSGLARWGASLLPTVALAVALAVVGVGGVRAVALLKHAMRPPGPEVLAGQICSELRAHQYDQLASQVDPSPDSTQKANAVLDPKTIAGKLRALDGSVGSVTKCGVQQLSYADGSSRGAVANFSLTLQREKQGNVQAILLILVQKPDGTWKVAPSTNLTPGA